jgi:predicted  nucleic acid-binding Zn-ribbon protein
MHKLQKALPVSSLIWAAIVTAIVLALAASAKAQEGEATSSITGNPAAREVRPVPPRPQPMPRASSTRPLERVNERPLPFNASGTRPLEKMPVRNASGTRPMNPGNIEGREAAMKIVEERRAAFEERRAALIENMDARKAAIIEKRALMASSTMARRAVLKEEARERIANRAGNLAEVVGNAIGRLESMSAKLRDHAVKFEERSIDVTDTKEILDEVDRLLVSAKETLDGIDTNISYATQSETPKEDWTDAKEQFIAVRTILTEVRELLREAVASLKASGKSEAPKPESVSSTTTEVMPANQ